MNIILFLSKKIMFLNIFVHFVISKTHKPTLKTGYFSKNSNRQERDRFLYGL